MMANLKAEHTVVVPVPTNAAELLALVWKLESLAEDEGVDLKNILPTFDRRDEDNFPKAGWEFCYVSKI